MGGLEWVWWVNGSGGAREREREGGREGGRECVCARARVRACVRAGEHICAEARSVSTVYRNRSLQLSYHQLVTPGLKLRRDTLDARKPLCLL